MTLQEIIDSDRPFLTVEHIGRVVGIRPDTLRIQARKDPSRLGFPVCVAEKTVRIPREAFIAWMHGKESKEESA